MPETKKLEMAAVFSVRWGVLMYCLFSVGLTRAQNLLVPLQRYVTTEVERGVSREDSLRHTSWKPFVTGRFDLTKVPGYEKDTSKYYYKFTTLLWRDNLVKVSDKDFSFTVDPLFDFGLTMDLADTSAYADTVRLWNNSRGLRIEASIGKVVAFQTQVIESQSYFPSYLKAFADSTGIVPGLGRWKRFRTSGFDYGVSSSVLTVVPANWLNVQLGYGKNFVGNGYRSMLLSDGAFNYPFLKATCYFAKDRLQYTAMVAQLQSLERLPLGEVPESLFKKKSASFYYLSWTPVPSIEVGVFESVVWQFWDSTGVQPMDPLMLVPVLGAGSAVNGLDGANNAMAGLNARVRLHKGLSLYGQVAVDGSSAEAMAYQAGAVFLDCLIPRLDVLVEWNYAGKDMYRSAIPLQSYTQFNQPLGSVAGPCSREWVAKMNFAHKRFITQLKFNRILRGSDPTCSALAPLGSDALPNTANPANQVIQQWELEAGFRMNPKTNMQLMLGFTDRLQSPDLAFHHTSAVFVAFRTNLSNRYFDF